MKLIIIGGGFCGAIIAKKFDKRRDVDVILIDKKSYYEYTPSIHKLISNRKYLDKITIPLEKIVKQGKVIISPLTNLTDQYVETKNEKIPYDYLVISTGIDYPIFLDNQENVFTLKSSINAMQINQKIVNAKHVLIIGGGLIGTEIAGELVTKMKDKCVTVIHSKNRLIERTPTKASCYAQKFLERKGAKIIFNEKIVGHEDQIFISDKGKKIEADLAIWCAGIRWSHDYLNGFDQQIFSNKGALKVNDYLQLPGFENIFVGGDVCSVSEEKTAQNARIHGSVILKNIDKSIANMRKISYKPKKRIMVISLGDFSGILIYGKIVITGIVPGIVKYIVQRITMCRYK
ncbi:NAD(P)/FAD-dependent oxidoreductase [[Eubacterium] cellulosolvens]